MKLKTQKLQVTDELGNDLLTNVCISSLSQSLIKKIVDEIEQKKNKRFSSIASKN